MGSRVEGGSAVERSRHIYIRQSGPESGPGFQVKVLAGNDLVEGRGAIRRDGGQRRYLSGVWGARHTLAMAAWACCNSPCIVDRSRSRSASTRASVSSKCLRDPPPSQGQTLRQRMATPAWQGVEKGLAVWRGGCMEGGLARCASWRQLLPRPTDALPPSPATQSNKPGQTSKQVDNHSTLGRE